MLKLLKKVLQIGESTVKYPFAPAEIAPGARGKPVYNYSFCIACGACASVCPSNAITIANDLEKGNRKWEIFYGRCIYCGRCEEVCPTEAITLSTDFELAAMKREDLIISAEFHLAKCQICGHFFSPAREMSWILSSLKDTGLSEKKLTAKRTILNTCPDCRRALAVENHQNALASTKEEVMAK